MLERFAELIIFGLAPLIFGGLLMPGAFAAEEITISGGAFYRERIALPPNAVLTVWLSDIPATDAPAAIVAEQKVHSAGQVPMRFELKVAPALVRPHASYALQARISVDDAPWFVSDELLHVDPRMPGPHALMLKMVTRQGEPTPG
jgi:putative lipoprotein